ncbi:putative two-component sensor histidine kinase [Alteromonas macleodii str. 'Black Sea 11']|nr:putative two-component sensor histidine kinase [Alteromonas macleodii str. 'Black Sea 11']NKW88739.1 histidine kinase [Alteromonadaceae bacterium A_SAG4]NKX18229.1 histidine kinase [Alteromonadaceae bacterium A_SAG5]NKX33967.1 histidine kinase [Alteromonadaceae bacterium A_SAG3]
MITKVLSSLYSWIILVVLVIVVITANSFYVVSTLNDLSALEARLFTTNRVINAVNRLHVAVLRVESGQRGYMLTGDEEYLTDYTETLSVIGELMDEVEVSSFSSDIEEQSARIEKLLALTKEKVNEVIEGVELYKAGNEQQAVILVNSDKGINLYKQFERIFREIDGSERDMQGTHLANLMSLRRDSVNTLIISSATTLLLIITVFLLLKINSREHEKYQADLESVNEDLESRIADRTQELSVYSDELARSNRELEDFAFVASHDLQEPLRKIRAFGNRLESGYNDVIDERGKDYLARMLNAAERMSMLISDLLAFSRVSTRGKDFDDVNLKTAVESILGDLEIAITEKSAQINVGDLPTVRGDKSQLEQVFLNLLSNALKFQSEGVTPVVNVSAQDATEEETKDLLLSEEYEWTKITVSDNGIGFDQSFAEKIFAPFQRLHGRSEYKGTGIGLAVCRRIVERHNGQITATSAPGKGATFSIIMPKDSEPFGSSNNNGETHNDA